MLNLGSAKVGALEESPPLSTNDESFQLLERGSPPAVPLEPPFSTPLAPFDMELMKRSGLHERLTANTESIWGGTQKFMDQERISASRESLSSADKRARFAAR